MKTPKGQLGVLVHDESWLLPLENSVLFTVADNWLEQALGGYDAIIFLCRDGEGGRPRTVYKEVTLFIWVWVSEKLAPSSTCDLILGFLDSFVLNNFKGQLGRAPEATQGATSHLLS